MDGVMNAALSFSGLAGRFRQFHTEIHVFDITKSVPGLGASQSVLKQ